MEYPHLFSPIQLNNLTLRNRIFGNSINPEKGKPTNRQFICSLADYVASYM